MRAKTDDEPRSPSYFLPSIDAALEAIIMRAIARAPRDRYATVAELLAHLRDPRAVVPDGPARASGKRAAGETALRAARRWAVPLGALLVVAALVALIALSGRRAPAPGTAPASGAAQPREK